jgi:hypothetical protein
MYVFYLHAGLMVAGFMLMVIGTGIAIFKRRERWWLRAHKTAGMLGASLIVLGLVAAILMVDQSGKEHIDVPHAWIGLVTVLFAIVTPSLGMLQFRIVGRAQQFREKHRWAGRITLISGFVTILAGLRIAGII